MNNEYFVSGIDTDCGKTFITGLLAYHTLKQNHTVITSKLIQTGCKGISEDILEHRKIMEISVLLEDKTMQTCPYVLSFPCSPHLALEIDNVDVDINTIRKSTEQLKKTYDIVLSEGAGGLMVPIKHNYLCINYLAEYKVPLILVSSNKLGSINHTLLSLEACKAHKINIKAFIYNKFPTKDPTITINTETYFINYLSANFPSTQFYTSDELAKDLQPNLEPIFS